MEKSEIDEILVPVPADKAKERAEKVRREFWPKMKAAAASIPFAEDAAAAWYCATDTNTPLKVRGTLMAALAYFILPFDTVPDILAFIGFTDDFAVLTAAIALVSNHVTEEHREKARAAIAEAKQGKDA